MPPEVRKKERDIKATEEYQTIRYAYGGRQLAVPNKQMVIKWLIKRGWIVEIDRPHCTKLAKGEYKAVPPGHALLYELEQDLERNNHEPN